MSQNDSRLDQIRKLLAMAENPAATPAERDAFNERATTLIAKYGIEKAMLDAAEPAQLVIIDRIVHVPAPYAAEKSALLHHVSEPLRVETVRRGGKRGQGFEVHCFGFEADLDRSEMLFTSLLVQVSHELATLQPDYYESTVAYRKAWLWGFIKTIRQRLDKAENRAAEDAGTGTDLVLADRSLMVQRRASEAYPEAKPLPRVKVRSNGYQHGQAAGHRASLGGNHVGHRVARRSIGA